MRSADQALGVPQPVSFLTLPARAARHAWRRSRESAFVLRAKYILYRYTAHYRRAQRAYRDAGHRHVDPRVSLDDVGVRVIAPRADDGLITLPPAYAGIVERVAGSVAAAFERSANCHFFPKPPGTVPERTRDIPALAKGEVITLQLLDPFAIDGLHDLCEPILRELERTLYGSFVIADKVYIYRNLVSDQRPRTSWRWHFDNHPREILKVMVYLTDVAHDTAPFQYLRERSSGAPLAGAPLAPMSGGDSRVPDEDVDRRLAGNWTCHSVTGARGTIVVFDNNIVHRGTMAKAAHRDVVVFQVRPATFHAARPIDAQWTGTFRHWDFNLDPNVLAARPRPGA